MLKKVITILLSICLIFSISVMTVCAVNETVPEAQQRAGERPGGGRGGMPPTGEMPSGEFGPPQGGFAPPQSNETNNTIEATAPQTDGDTPAENSQTPGENQQFGGQMPRGMGGFPGNMQNFNEQTQEEQPVGFWGFVKTNSTPITSVILLALAFIFVIFYRRKNY